jgi:TRAP-type C4-dicarboxylate transport system permease small subunit
MEPMASFQKTKGPMKRIIRILVKFYDGILSLLVYVAVGLILFLVVLICASVFVRRTPYAIGWDVEASEYILLLMTFFGTGWVLRNGGHINVDVFLNLLPRRKQEIYQGILYSIVAALCLAFTIIGISTAWDAYVSGTLQVKVYTFPKWILMSLIPLAGFFLFVESLKTAWRQFAGKAVLVVDDEKDILETIRALLTGYRVETAMNFQGAAAKLKEKVYDAVILDIMGVRGLDLLKVSTEKGLPTIMLTAHAMNPAALKESMQGGAVSFVPKEKLDEIGAYVDDIVKVGRKEARVRFYLRLGSYFDHRFGLEWDRTETFWLEARKAMDDQPRQGPSK